MSDALRDQLMKAGLADEKSANKAAREARKARQRRSKAPGGEVAATAAAARQRAVQAKLERQERDREINRQREAEKAGRAVAAQVDDLLKAHGLDMKDGSIAYSFAHGTVIRRIHVTADQQSRLARGALAIVHHRRRYHLVPAATAESIRERSPDTFICRVEEPPAGDEDAYADFPVPDDLHW